MQLLVGKTGRQKVTIIDQSVLDSGVRQVSGELGLPYALSEPESASIHSEPPANRLVHPLDLFHSIGSRQRGQYRLVEAGQQQLDLTIADQTAELVEICALMLFEPFQQRSGKVQHDRREAVSRQSFQDRAVDVADVLLEDVVEVADRLVQVKAEDEADRLHAQPTTREREPPSAAATAGSTLGNT